MFAPCFLEGLSSSTFIISHPPSVPFVSLCLLLALFPLSPPGGPWASVPIKGSWNAASPKVCLQLGFPHFLWVTSCSAMPVFPTSPPWPKVSAPWELSALWGHRTLHSNQVCWFLSLNISVRNAPVPHHCCPKWPGLAVSHSSPDPEPGGFMGEGVSSQPGRQRIVLCWLGSF